MTRSVEGKHWICHMYPARITAEQTAKWEEGQLKAEKRTGLDSFDSVESVRFPQSCRFAREAKVGDEVFWMSRPSASEPPDWVYRRSTIVFTNRSGRNIFFYYKDTGEMKDQRITWAQFLKLCKASLFFTPAPGTERQIKLEESNNLEDRWPR